MQSWQSLAGHNVFTNSYAISNWLLEHSNDIHCPANHMAQQRINVNKDLKRIICILVANVYEKGDAMQN